MFVNKPTNRRTNQPANGERRTVTHCAATTESHGLGFRLGLSFALAVALPWMAFLSRWLLPCLGLPSLGLDSGTLSESLARVRLRAVPAVRCWGVSRARSRNTGGSSWLEEGRRRERHGGGPTRWIGRYRSLVGFEVGVCGVGGASMSALSHPPSPSLLMCALFVFPFVSVSCFAASFSQSLNAY